MRNNEGTVQVMDITPEMAKKWLKKNTCNRPLRWKWVLFLAEQQSNGRWKVNGDAIRFSHDGRLIDGQHRLYAIIESGVTIRSYVITGLDFEVFDTVDGGSKRTGGDILSILGEKNATTLAGALMYLKKYLSGSMTISTSMSPVEMEELLNENPDIRDSVKHCVKYRTKMFSTSLMSALHYVFSYYDQEEADRFAEKLSTGVGLESGDPVYVLRERLMQNLISKSKLPGGVVGALMIRAWNATRDGKKVKFVQWKNGQKFPLAR